MREVEWTDRKGYKHKSLLRRGDPDELAPAGISQDPPDIGKIDWGAVKRDLHNNLLARNLCTYEDVEKAQKAVSSAILAALRRRVVRLYRDSRR